MNPDYDPQIPGDRTSKANYRIIGSSEIKMHIAEEVEGPLVVFATALRNCGTLGGVN